MITSQLLWLLTWLAFSPANAHTLPLGTDEQRENSTKLAGNALGQSVSVEHQFQRENQTQARNVSSTNTDSKGIASEEDNSQTSSQFFRPNLQSWDASSLKKVYIISVLLCLCGLLSCCLCCVNIKHDYSELPNFYRGYMGRKLMIEEKQMVYKSNVDLLLNELTSSESEVQQNGYIEVDTQERNPQGRPLEAVRAEAVVKPGFPLSRRFVEDEDSEWRDLDYTVEVGKLPDSFVDFWLQYDWDYYGYCSLSSEEIRRRRHLLMQFKMWKQQKRKIYNIVVTERARREMAEQEEEKTNRRKHG